MTFTLTSQVWEFQMPRVRRAKWDRKDYATIHEDKLVYSLSHGLSSLDGSASVATEYSVDQSLISAIGTMSKQALRRK